MSTLLESEAVRLLLDRAPRGLVTEAVRSAIASARSDPASAPATPDDWGSAVAAALELSEQRSLRPVINATGVVLHTNLGRAPLADAALNAVRAVSGGYSNLEYDLSEGARGSRYAHCATLLRELTGAEDALVVNNGAAALVLALNTLADGRDAIVSRGELVEIGGSFRVPDIMAKSGARLVEVGTTNRTHPDDYRRALTPETGAVVKVHRSNFSLEGFVSDVDVRRLSLLAGEHGVPVIHDLGSGLLRSLETFGLSGEPLPADSLRDGATLVTMSGDKLLGGPQAGILLGRADAVARARRNSLTRALRVDKMTLAALEATLALYRDVDRARREIPTLAMLTFPVEALRARAHRLAGVLAARGIAAEVVSSESSVGGGAFPTTVMPSAALALGGEPGGLDRRLRSGPVAVIGRTSGGHLLLDLRSVMERDDEALAEAIAGALA
ncbi:MAG: L-seryl-tRNA(Sec) selenium transferase [Gemmatimonadota bacterium]|nr:L-seryl-tRNA(Sec) selenium transferase [Gemmatimonadota bacterium]